MSSLSLDKFQQSETVSVPSPMTVNGTVVRTSILLLTSAFAGVLGWLLLPASLVLPGLLLGVGGAILFSVLAGRRPLNAKLPAFGYALMQGVLLGAVARSYESSQSGIVLMALLLTVATVVVTLVLFATGLVRLGAKARSLVLMATLSVFVFYAVSILLSLLGVQLSFLWDASPLGYLFSIVVLFIAVMNLFSDYTVVEQAISEGADERFEWFAAFGLTATVLWIFVEFLRLLGRSR